MGSPPGATTSFPGPFSLERSCCCCKRQSGCEETSQRPYSPRRDLGNKLSYIFVIASAKFSFY